VAEGSDVSIYYDPLLAKVIGFGETRHAAIARLTSALRDFPILGIQTNLPFLLRLLEHPRFQAADVDTGFLDREDDALARPAQGAAPPHVLAAIAAHSADDTGAASPQRFLTWDPWRQLHGWRG
jgi:acetyl/propionyl-CoA carboxylase alpha subunit